MKSNAIKRLEQALAEQTQRKHPGVPGYAIPKFQRSDTTANGLTQCIIEYVRLQGWQAERVVVMGKPIEEATGVRWVKSQMTIGTADIHCTIAGRSVKIEVKIGGDRQSDEQKRYQQAIECAGGIYYIARNFQTFVDWYERTFNYGL